MGLSAVKRCRLISFVARQAHPCIPHCAGLDKLFHETHDGNAAFQALREYRKCKKAPAALIAVSALDISGWNSMTKREVALLRPVLHAAICIFDPACATLFATEPGTAVVPSAVTEEESGEEEAHAAEGPELCLMAVDKQYPVIRSIRALLPDDEQLLKRVLSNPDAAKAIMYLTDWELCQNVMRAHGAQADRYMFVMLDGLPYKLSELSALDFKRWLRMRDMAAEHLGVAALKRLVWNRVKHSTPDELISAKARIANVVKEFQRVE
jgi:hypothetical protein